MDSNVNSLVESILFYLGGKYMLSGWLSPAGVFFPCCKGLHSTIAEEVLIKCKCSKTFKDVEVCLYGLGYIKLSDFGGGVIFFPYTSWELRLDGRQGNKISKLQLDWFTESFKELSEEQREWLDMELCAESEDIMNKEPFKNTNYINDVANIVLAVVVPMVVPMVVTLVTGVLY